MDSIYAQYQTFSAFCPAVPLGTFVATTDRLASHTGIRRDWCKIYNSGDLTKARFSVQAFRLNMLCFGNVPRPIYAIGVKAPSPVDFLFNDAVFKHWHREGPPIELIKRRAELLCPLPKTFPYIMSDVSKIPNISNLSQKTFYDFFWRMHCNIPQKRGYGLAS